MTLTREEILAMKPGLQIDMLIGQYVIKFEDYLKEKVQRPVVRDGRFGINYFDLPEYSTDISAAWEVVKHLMNDRKDVIVQCVSFEVNRLFDCAIYEHEEEVAVTSMLGSAQEAICKAALLAVLNL